MAITTQGWAVQELLGSVAAGIADPIGRTAAAPVWNEETVMDWPNAAERRSFRQSEVPQRPSVDYRFGIYEYEYEWDDDEGRGRFVPGKPSGPDGAQPLPARLRRALGLQLP